MGLSAGFNQVEADAVQGLVSIDYDRRVSSLIFLLKLKETFSSLFPEVSTTKLAASDMSQSLKACL